MWILILYMHIGYGTAVTSTAFDTQAACIAAGTGIKAQVKGPGNFADFTCNRKAL